MKINTSAKKLIVDDSIEAHDFTIEAEDAGHIISMLSDKLYSDKILAVCREYMANAFDACVEAKSDRPIEVMVPNTLSPTFAVRDFGLGLSKEDVLNVFIKMGKSTKRDTDDQVGAFGIGGKSFRAYGDAMNIISIHNGVKTVYSAQKTGSGGNRLFVIGSEDTNEHSGIEISLPVNPKDINEFERKIINLSKFFKVIPILKGTSKKIPEIKKGISGEDWFVFDDESQGWSHQSYVLMGNIPYPISTNFVEDVDRNFIREVNVCFCSGIGQVDIAPDREKLEYTTKTKRFIKKSVTKARNEFIEKFKENIRDAKTYQDAIDLYVSRNLRLVPTDDVKGLKWQDKDIVVTQKTHNVVRDKKTGKSEIKILFDVDVKHVTIYNDRAKFRDNSSWSYGPDTALIVNDGVSYSLRRIKWWFRNSQKRNGIVVSGNEIDKFLKAINADLLKDHVVWLKDVDYDKVKRDYAQGSTTSHIKVFYLRPAAHSSVKDNWKEAVESDIPEKEQKFFVPISRFSWTKGDLDALKKYRRFFHKELDRKIVIYGIREREVKNLDNTWVEFTQATFEKEIDKWINALPAEFADCFCACNQTFNAEDLKKYFKGNAIPSEVKEYLDKVELVRGLQVKYDKKINVVNDLRHYLSGKLPKSTTTKEMEKKIVTAYPLLTQLTQRTYWWDNENKFLQRYIKLENIAKGIDKPSSLM